MEADNINKRIDELEKRVRELETRQPTIIINPAPIYYPQPWIDYQPYYTQPVITCGHPLGGPLSGAQSCG